MDTQTISQDTITRAGLAPQGSDIASMMGQRDDAMQLQQSQAGNVRGLQQMKSDVVGPKLDQVAEATRAPMPDAPKLERSPEYQRPTVTPQDMNESFGMLLATAMLVGAGSRQPFYDAMSAMTGAMKGWQAKDEQLVDDSMKAFDKNLSAIKERNDAARADFDAAWKKYGNNIQRLEQEVKIIAAKFDMPIAAAQADMGATQDRIATLDAQIKSGQQAIMAMQKISQQAADKKADRELKEKEIAERAAYHKGMLAKASHPKF